MSRPLKHQTGDNGSSTVKHIPPHQHGLGNTFGFDRIRVKVTITSVVSFVFFSESLTKDPPW